MLKFSVFCGGKCKCFEEKEDALDYAKNTNSIAYEWGYPIPGQRCPDKDPRRSIMKVTFEIEMQDNQDSLAALIALITKAAKDGTQPATVTNKPKDTGIDDGNGDGIDDGADDGVAETPAQKKKRSAKEKRTAKKAAEAAKAAKAAKEAAEAAKEAAEAEEMTDDETDGLDDVDEEGLREELLKAAKTYRKTYGKAALIALLREYEGITDAGKPSMSAVPAENLVDFIKALQE